MTAPAHPFGQEDWARARPHPPTSQIGTPPRRGKRQQLSMKKQVACPWFNAAQRAWCHQYTAFLMVKSASSAYTASPSSYKMKFMAGIKAAINRVLPRQSFVRHLHLLAIYSSTPLIRRLKANGRRAPFLVVGVPATRLNLAVQPCLSREDQSSFLGSAISLNRQSAMKKKVFACA